MSMKLGLTHNDLVDIEGELLDYKIAVDGHCKRLKDELARFEARLAAVDTLLTYIEVDKERSTL